MKLIILLFFISFLSISTIQAQTLAQKPVKEAAIPTIDVLAQKLQLSVAQKKDVAKTLNAFKATEDRLKASAMSKAEKEAALAKVAARRESNLQTFLSEEQFAMYKKLTVQ